jgi:hypothetical protein
MREGGRREPEATHELIVLRERRLKRPGRVHGGDLGLLGALVARVEADRLAEVLLDERRQAAGLLGIEQEVAPGANTTCKQTDVSEGPPVRGVHTGGADVPGDIQRRRAPPHRARVQHLRQRDPALDLLLPRLVVDLGLVNALWRERCVVPRVVAVARLERPVAVPGGRAVERLGLVVCSACQGDGRTKGGSADELAHGSLRSEIV